MRRIAVTLAAVALALVSPGLLSSALAHGAASRSPPAEPPPSNPESTDPPPPPPPPSGNPGGTEPQTPIGDPSAPPPSGGAPNPSTPPGGPGGSGGGGGGGGPGGAPGGGGGAGNRAPGAAKGPGYDSWAYWWAHNRDEILRLRTVRHGLRTGDAFGRRGATVMGVTDAAVRERVVPALRTLLARESANFHIRSAAELALAKIGDASIASSLRQMAMNPANSLHREIVETAPLALGLLQDDGSATKLFLVDLVRDERRDGTFARPFAAISLGLLGERNDAEHDVVAALVEVIARRERGVNVKPAAIAALGLLGGDAALSELLRLSRHGRASTDGAVELGEIERAWVVSALGRIGLPGLAAADEESAVLDEVLRIVGRDWSKPGGNLRRSAVIALGQIGPQCPAKSQRRVGDALRWVVAETPDEQERGFALMSLGRLGAARTIEPALRREIVAALGRTLAKGQGQSPAFAAMALGLVGRAMGNEGLPAPEDEIRAPLRSKFAEDGPAQIRGAFALASGLVRDPLAVGPLMASLKDRGADKRVRGWSALALGLIGAREAADAIRATLRDDVDRDLRVQAAMAAGLLDDARVVEDLIALIRDDDASSHEMGSAAIALGHVGDERSVDALVELALDEKGAHRDLTRALAVVALGSIGDRRDAPLLARFSTDVNYRAHVPALTELLSIL